MTDMQSLEVVHRLQCRRSGRNGNEAVVANAWGVLAE
jgi:hypothetical protein